MQFFALLNGRPTIFQGLYLDGGPSTPAISFANDQTTGFYKVAAAPGVVYFGALGSGSLRFAGSGYLYAGQSNSFLQLSSAGTITLSVDTGSNGAIVFETVGTGTHVFRNLSGVGTRTRLEIAQTGLRVYYIENTATTGHLAFGNGSGESFRITTSRGLNIGGTADIAAGNLDASGQFIGRLQNTQLYQAQLEARNSAPSLTNGALSQAVFAAQPGYTTYVGTTGDGTNASYRVNALGGVVFNSQGYLISDGANGLLIHSINQATLFATGNTGAERMRLNLAGNLLLGTATDSSNGRIQLADHTTMAGGIGIGTDISLYRRAASSVRLEGTLAGTQFEVHDGARGFQFITSGGNDIVFASVGNTANGLYLRAHNGQLVLQSNAVTALTLSTTQTATFASTVITAASVAGQAGLRLPHGAAPTAPVNGDVWTTTAGLYVRINGATVGPLT